MNVILRLHSGTFLNTNFFGNTIILRYCVNIHMFLKLCHFWILDNLYYLALKTAAPVRLRFIFHELQVPCVYIDQLFIFCPCWPIFLFLFSLEHQIGIRRPVHIDQVPIFLFRNKVENSGSWCTWDKLQVVASELLHCSASLQQDALVLHWVVFQWCCSIICVTVVPQLAAAVSQFCSATVFQGTCNMITTRCS